MLHLSCELRYGVPLWCPQIARVRNILSWCSEEDSCVVPADEGVTATGDPTCKVEETEGRILGDGPWEMARERCEQVWSLWRLDPRGASVRTFYCAGDHCTAPPHQAPPQVATQGPAPSGTAPAPWHEDSMPRPQGVAMRRHAPINATSS